MKAIKLDASLVLVWGRDGIFLVNNQDWYIGKALEIYGEYSAIEADFLNSLLMAGDNVIEIGANIGALTVGLANRVGPTGKVFAFEPQPACYRLLQSQVALNQINNIAAYNKAVGNNASILWLPPVDYTQPGNFGGISLENKPSKNSVAVKVTTLDKVFSDIAIDLIKIDVEGMEHEVISGAKNLIERCKPILYVENDRELKSPALIKLILSLGYRIWWHFPALFNNNNFFTVKENLYPKIVSFNMLCVHASVYMPQSELVEIKSANDLHPIAWNQANKN